MKNNNEKYGWAAVTVIAVIMFAVIIYNITGSFGTKNEVPSDSVEVEVVSPEILRSDSIITGKIEKVIENWRLSDSTELAITLYDATIRHTVYRRNSSDTLAPASCMKIATAIAALKTLGMDYQFTTTLKIRGEVRKDTLHGDLQLNAPVDPLIESFDTLAQQLAKQGIRHIDGNIIMNLDKEDRLQPHPSALAWDIPAKKLNFILKGKNVIYSELIGSLRNNGITFRENTKVQPKGEYRQVASVSTPLTDIVSRMLIFSSNKSAEALFYKMDLNAKLLPDHNTHWEIKHYVPSFIKKTFADDSLTMARIRICDGSGLSPKNRLTTDFLVSMLRYVYMDKQLFEFFTQQALATPGNPERSGSLGRRMGKEWFQDRVFVKTGTIVTIGTSSLAGFIHGKDDHWYIFSVINGNAPIEEGRLFQDKFCEIFVK